MSECNTKTKKNPPEFKRTSRLCPAGRRSPRPLTQKLAAHRLRLENLGSANDPAATVRTHKTRLFVACLVSHLQHAAREPRAVRADERPPAPARTAMSVAFQNGNWPAQGMRRPGRGSPEDRRNEP